MRRKPDPSREIFPSDIFVIPCVYLRPGRCVKADPEADFADLLDPLWFNVLDAAVAAFAEVTFTAVFVCDSAEPAADFAALLELGLLKTFDAADAAFLLVISLLFCMVVFLRIKS